MTTKTKKDTPKGAQNQRKNTTPKTQKQIVLAELKRRPKKGITAWDMITKHHITRTSAYIWELIHKDKVPIIATDERGNGNHYARYTLAGEEKKDGTWRAY